MYPAALIISRAFHRRRRGLLSVAERLLFFIALHFLGLRKKISILSGYWYLL